VIEQKYDYEIIKNENGVKEYVIKSARK
jgi:hypothetical protein